MLTLPTPKGNRAAMGVPVKWSAVLAVLAAGCTSAPADSDTAADTNVDTSATTDGFGDAGTVRITSPSSNETLTETVTVTFETGQDVVYAQMYVDGEPSGTRFSVEGDLTRTVLATVGTHVVRVNGFDINDNPLSSDSVSVRVVDADDVWVSLVHPSDNSHPINPVQFSVSAAPLVEEIELFANGNSIGTVGDNGILTYEFPTTGAERTIEARGYDSEGTTIATDTLEITPESAEDVPSSSFNDLILDLLPEYPESSNIEYYWPAGEDWSGSTRDIYYKNELVANDGGYHACFCVGLTWEIYLRAWQEMDLATGGTGNNLNSMTVDDVLEMQDDWFVRDLDGPGQSVALPNYGLGTEVESFADWQPGDFIQFWRNNGSGHNVIFIDWVLDEDNNRLGFEYFSCNGESSTDGPGYNEEYFGAGSSKIDASLTYAGRAYMPEDWFNW